MFPVYSVTYVPGPYPALRSVDRLVTSRDGKRKASPVTNG